MYVGTDRSLFYAYGPQVKARDIEVKDILMPFTLIKQMHIAPLFEYAGLVSCSVFHFAL